MYATLLIWLLLTPLVLSLIAFTARWPGPFTRQTVEVFHLISVSLVLVLSLMVVYGVLTEGAVVAMNDWLHVDSLAAVFLLIIGVSGFLVGVYSVGFTRNELKTGDFDEHKLCSYYGLFSLFLFTMLMIVTANNIIMMWVAVEATTLGSAFLVGIYGTRSALEAAWKYVMICTAGVAFGLYGTILVYSDAVNVLVEPETAVLWTEIVKSANLLDPTIIKMAFVFILIGFGTKAGIFPMHAWLPDAQSEAPSPVSALLSAVLDACALLVIIRYYTIVSQAVGPAFPQGLFIVFGSLSIAAAVFFMFRQQDIKRLLAYSSIENIGLMVLALGIGGQIGILAALLHVINHSLVKSLMFCAAGNIAIKYRTRNMELVKGLLRAAPLTSVLLIGGTLALTGAPPFNIFVSKFYIISAGIGYGYFWLMVPVLLLLMVVFASFFRMIGSSVLGQLPGQPAGGSLGFLTQAPLAVFLILILVMGLYLPPQVGALLNHATGVVMGGSPDVVMPGGAQTGLPAFLTGLEQVKALLPGLAINLTGN